MSHASWHLSSWLKNPWAERTDKIASEVERASEVVMSTNTDIQRATLDHADSTAHVRTTVGAVLDRLERRGIRSDA